MFARIAAIGLILLLAPAAGAQTTLKTAVDGTFAPHAMPKLSGGIEGFNVDLAEAIGKQLGKTVTVDAAPVLRAHPGPAGRHL